MCVLPLLPDAKLSGEQIASARPPEPLAKGSCETLPLSLAPQGQPSRLWPSDADAGGGAVGGVGGGGGGGWRKQGGQALFARTATTPGPAESAQRKYRRDDTSAGGDTARQSAVENDGASIAAAAVNFSGDLTATEKNGADIWWRSSDRMAGPPGKKRNTISRDGRDRRSTRQIRPIARRYNANAIESQLQENTIVKY